MLRSAARAAKAVLERAREQSGVATKIDLAKVDAFARLINEKLNTGDVNVRRAYIRSIVTGPRWTTMPEGAIAELMDARAQTPMQHRSDIKGRLKLHPNNSEALGATAGAVNAIRPDSSARATVAGCLGVARP